MHASLRAIVVCLLACPAIALASNGPAPTTSGVKGPVSLAVDGDGQTFYKMPSSIGWNLDHQVDLDVFLFYGESTLRNDLNDFNGSGSTFGGSIGVVFTPGRPDFDAELEDGVDPVSAPEGDPTSFEDPWDTYTYAHKVSFAFGVFPAMSGGGGGSKVRLTSFPDTVELKKGIRFIDITSGVAFTPTEWLSFGLNLHVIYATLDIDTLVGGGSTPLNGSPQIMGVPIPGNPSYADFLNLLSSDGASDPTTFFESELQSWQFASTLAVSFRPMDNLGIGFSYRDRSWDPQRFKGTAEIDATRTFEQLDPAIIPLLLATLPNGGSEGFTGKYDVEITGVHVPRQIRLNLVWWPTDWLLLAGEVAWIEWHRAFRITNVRLSSGNNEDLNFVVGSNKIHTKLDSFWKNQWVFSLYSAVGVDDFSFRLGFVYGETPFNEREAGVSPNSGLSDTTVMFGMGWRVLGGPVELSWMVEHSFHSSQRSGDGLDTLTANNSYFSAKQWFFHIGATIKF